MAKEFTILEKVKPIPIWPASAGDFVLREQGEVDSAEIAENPHLSLYALDKQNQ